MFQFLFVSFWSANLAECATLAIHIQTHSFAHFFECGVKFSSCEKVIIHFVVCFSSVSVLNFAYKSLLVQAVLNLTVIFFCFAFVNQSNWYNEFMNFNQFVQIIWNIQVREFSYRRNCCFPKKIALFNSSQWFQHCSLMS